MAIVKIAPPSGGVEPVILRNHGAREEAKKAAAAIGKAFVWEQTQEGMVFWGSVKRRLEQIAENGELK